MKRSGHESDRSTAQLLSTSYPQQSVIQNALAKKSSTDINPFPLRRHMHKSQRCNSHPLVNRPPLNTLACQPNYEDMPFRVTRSVHFLLVTPNNHTHKLGNIELALQI